MILADMAARHSVEGGVGEGEGRMTGAAQSENKNNGVDETV